MEKLTKVCFLEKTSEILDRTGYSELSLSDVLKACNASKGSLYHFFPAGKDELMLATIQYHGDRAVETVRSLLGKSSSCSEAVAGVANFAAKALEDSRYRFGLPLSAVAATAGSHCDIIRSACESILSELEKLYYEKILATGVPKGRAKDMASVVSSTIDGAFIRSRSQRSSVPMKNASRFLKEFLSF